MTRLALALLAACAALPAQAVRLANYSPLPFVGWVRTTVDTAPAATGRASDAEWVRGRRIGLDTWAVDVRVRLAPDEQRTVHLVGPASPWRLGSLPADPVRHFGALFPTVGGATMRLVSIEADGAGAAMRFAARLGLLHVDVWALWRPDEPGLVIGECVVCASNPSVPDVTTNTDSGFAPAAGNQPRAQENDGNPDSNTGSESDPPLLRVRTPAATPASSEQADWRPRDADGGTASAERGDQRGTAQALGGEGLFRASGAASAVEQGIRLAWGDALVHVAGAGWGAPVLAGSIANGQARGVPFAMVWPRNIATDTDAQWLGAIGAVRRSVCAVGIERLLPDGNPTFVGDAKTWTTDRYAESLRRLHTWEPALIGPNPRSGDTGAQEDQVFVRGECFAGMIASPRHGDGELPASGQAASEPSAVTPSGLGAEQVAYFGALKTLARPCHHLLADGTIVDPTTAEPRLIYWDGVPHWHTGVSPNRLGKSEWPTIEQTHGWAGPDVEHWLINTTAAASRLVDSQAMQWELRHQAFLYFGQWTTTPGWSTTQPYAARAVGWEGIAAVHLWRGLEDRALAERVRAHWQKRANDVILPAWRDRDIVDIRANDPRLGPGDWWVAWQQAVGAYGLDLACAQIGPAEGRTVALRVARAVVDRAWVKVGDRWQSRAQMPVVGESPADESFNYFGCSLAVAVVLRHDPNDERARSIWAQLVATPERGASWLAPGISQRRVE